MVLPVNQPDESGYRPEPCRTWMDVLNFFMDFERLLQCLASDYARLREVASSTDFAAAVPSCPGWSVADLIRHVGEVYLHKTLAMREGAEPEPWPPPGLADEAPLPLLDRAHTELLHEFNAHKPEDPAGSWYAPDPTVGFWIRRMAQETVIHRIDAELATGQPVAVIPTDLALDGIDELLKVFVDYAVSEWPRFFDDVLDTSPGRIHAIRAGEASWTVHTGPGAFAVANGNAGHTPDVSVTGPPPAVLRWLWNRLDTDEASGVSINGTTEAVKELRGCITIATQ